MTEEVLQGKPLFLAVAISHYCLQTHPYDELLRRPLGGASSSSRGKEGKSQPAATDITADATVGMPVICQGGSW